MTVTRDGYIMGLNAGDCLGPACRRSVRMRRDIKDMQVLSGHGKPETTRATNQIIPFITPLIRQPSQAPYVMAPSLGLVCVDNCRLEATRRPRALAPSALSPVEKDPTLVRRLRQYRSRQTIGQAHLAPAEAGQSRKYLLPQIREKSWYMRWEILPPPISHSF